MTLVKLQIPPGMVRPGTVYDARGRWYDGNLVRWHEGALQAVGGWAVLSNATSAAISGPVRGMLAWRRNAGTGYVAFGTHEAIFVYSAGTLTDVTDGSFTTGAVDASGSFYARTEANSWQFDTFGEDLVAVAYSDGRILYWDSSAGGDVAALAGAPTGCRGVVVTPERFVVALGASSDGRLVQWSDQEDATDWTATTINQAGDFILPGSGQIMAGRRSKNETLIWTDSDLFGMRYIGGTFVYSFQLLGEGGAISRRSMAMMDGRAYWMGARGFFAYDGAVRPIPCEVGDYVFNRLNRAQASKIAAVVSADFNEVTWYYPSNSGSENDSYVTYDYLENHWTIGSIVRTDGIDRGFLQYPLLADADGCVYEHENGTTYADEGGSPSYTPYVESGPVEIGDGDRVMHVTGYIPDEETLGEVNTRIYSRLYPTGTETTHGPYTNTNPTNVRITARQVRVRHTQVTGGFRIGTPRLDVKPGGKR